MSESQKSSKSKKAKVGPDDKVVATVPAATIIVAKTRKKQSATAEFGPDVKVFCSEARFLF